MASERSLLERLDRAGGTVQGEGRRLRVNSDREAQSVLEHLQRMLNVRQGNAPALPRYGMPDFNDLATRFPEAIVELQRAIKTSIEYYEPRLRKVRIQHVPEDDDPLSVRFEITAQLITGEDDPAVRFETAVDTSGRVSTGSMSIRG